MHSGAVSTTTASDLQSDAMLGMLCSYLSAMVSILLCVLYATHTSAVVSGH